MSDTKIENPTYRYPLYQPGFPLQQLLDRCPDATWNQVFVVVDHLSRTGGIRLTAKGRGRYHVELQVAQHRPEIHE